MDADNIQVSDCTTFIYSSGHGVCDPIVEDGCTFFHVKNSTFTNFWGPVMRVKQRKIRNIDINNNCISNIYLDNNARVAVVEIGAGNIFSDGKNIKIENNVVSNCIWQNSTNENGGAALMVIGCESVSIRANTISNVYSDNKTHPSARRASAIYVKAVDCNIENNRLINAGDGEGAIIMKGIDTAPLSWSNYSNNCSPKNLPYTSAISKNVYIKGNVIKFIPNTNEPTNVATNFNFKTKVDKKIVGILAYNRDVEITCNQIMGVSIGVELRATTHIGDSPDRDDVLMNITIANNSIALEYGAREVGSFENIRGIIIGERFQNIKILNNEISFSGDIDPNSSIYKKEEIGIYIAPHNVGFITNKSETLLISNNLFEHTLFGLSDINIGGTTNNYLKSFSIRFVRTTYGTRDNDFENIKITDNYFYNSEQAIFFAQGQNNNTVIDYLEVSNNLCHDCYKPIEYSPSTGFNYFNDVANSNPPYSSNWGNGWTNPNCNPCIFNTSIFITSPTVSCNTLSHLGSSQKDLINQSQVSIVNDFFSNSFELFQGVKLSPNPTNNHLTITNGKGYAIIYNLLGQVMQEYQITEDIQEISTSVLRAGQYVIVIKRADGTVESKRFVKL